MKNESRDKHASRRYDIEELDANHAQGLLLAIHRNKVSDAYTVFLFDDDAKVEAQLSAATQTLVFAPATTEQSDAPQGDPG